VLVDIEGQDRNAAGERCRVERRFVWLPSPARSTCRSIIQAAVG